MKVEHSGYSAGRRYWPEVESSSSWFQLVSSTCDFHFRGIIRCVRDRWAPRLLRRKICIFKYLLHISFTISGGSLFIRRGIFHSLTSPSGPAKLLVRSGSCKAGACRSWGCSRWASKKWMPGIANISDP